MNKFIVIEGALDGIGKSTQFEYLKNHLTLDGFDVVSHHFPTYDEYQGEGVKRYLKGEFGDVKDLSSYFVNCLYACDRAITWNTKLKKEYLLDKTILLDRYTTSSLIYQSCLIDDIEEKNKFLDYVVDFEYNKLGIKEPDVTIFLWAPFDLITKLREKRKLNEGEAIDGDIHENDLSFMKKVYDNATYVCDYFGWNKVDCSLDGEFRSIEDIHNEIYSIINGDD